MAEPKPSQKDYAIAQEVLMELARASSLFGPFGNGHEGLGVVREEYLELEKAIFWRDGDPRVEAIQLAAMAIRFVRDVSDRPPSRSKYLPVEGLDD